MKMVDNVRSSSWKTIATLIQAEASLTGFVSDLELFAALLLSVPATDTMSLWGLSTQTIPRAVTLG